MIIIYIIVAVVVLIVPIWLIIKKQSMDYVTKMFNAATRMVNVTLYADLCAIYSKDMDKEDAGVLAAQVVNFLNGEKQKKEGDLQEPTKSSFSRIKNQIQQKAMEKMRADAFTREVIVNTLRMRGVIQFNNNKSYLESPEHERIYSILKEFGQEFPKAVVLGEYEELVLKYHQERFKQ